jgi:diguanylate cyclase (GGDEF)-like protein/PAS domain S-box-containing protein
VVVDALPVMVSTHDREGRITLANKALAAFRGHTEAELIGRRPGAMTDEVRDIAAALAAGAQLPFREVDAEGGDGSRRTLLTTVAPVAGDGGAISSVVRIGIDISERKAAEEQIRYLAEHDSLTGLPNRLLFSRALNRALADRPLVALHLVDLDNFKDVNDSLGHAAGDALLLTAVGRMRRCLRPGDLLARLGGDEFGVIQVEPRSEAGADELAARIVRALTSPYGIDGAQVQAGASIGIAMAPANGAEGPVLMQQADIALHRAKGAGRGQAQRFSAEMAAEQNERRQLEAEVKQALSDNALEFEYQPKFRVSDLGFAGCEALLRWRHPVRGPVPPGVFIPAAEGAGLSTRLARYTLRAALRQQAAWRQAGVDVRVAVNISARHIVSGQVNALLREALELEGGRAERIEIEVTEDVFIRDPAAAAGTLSKLRDIGVRLALDDFGTGYSALGYLQQLPFDVIKLDRSFVAGLGTSTRTERIVDAVVRIAHGLGASLVAEGVETAAQLTRLRDIGCDEAQGFLLGRPMPAQSLALLAGTDAAPQAPRAAPRGGALTSAA